MPDAFDVRPLDLSPDGLRQLAGLLNRVWPAARHVTPDYLAWQYAGNPAGPARGANAFAPDGALVSHFSLHPFRAWLLGEEALGLIIFNIATHPDWRGRGLFRRLADPSLEAARDAGFDFFFGVTNQQSLGVFGGWGYEVVCPLEARLGLGVAPPRRDDGGRAFQRRWDAATLAWRLGDPQRRYTRVRRAGRSVLYAPTGRFGVRAEMGTFDDALVPARVPEQGAFPPLRLWIGIDRSRDWSRSPWLALPRRLRPSPLVLMFHDFTGRGRRVDPGRARFDALDFDAF
jgi:GNAT superfamily N-acetyltransferase